MKHLKTFENYNPDNDFQDSEGELPQEVKDALENAVNQLSPEEIEELKTQFVGVTEEEIEDAVEDAQAQAQVDIEAPTNENIISKNKGAIGASLLIASLVSLGILGEEAEHLSNILKDDQTLNVLTNPTWLASSIGLLVGLIMTGSAAKGGFAKAAEASKLEWEKNMVRKGIAKKDENGVLVSLRTGKPITYAR